MAVGVSTSALSPQAQQLAYCRQPVTASSFPTDTEQVPKRDSFSPRDYELDDFDDELSVPVSPKRTSKRKQRARCSPLSSPAQQAKKPVHRQLLEIERPERTKQRQRRKRGVLSKATQLYADRTRRSQAAIVDPSPEGDKGANDDGSEEEKTMSVYDRAKMTRMVRRPQGTKIMKPHAPEEELGAAVEDRHVQPCIQRSLSIVPTAQISRIARTCTNAPSRADKERIVVQTLYELPLHLIIDLFLPCKPNCSTSEKPVERHLQRGVKGNEDTVSFGTRFMLETRYKQHILSIDFSALANDQIDELLVIVPVPLLVAVFRFNGAPRQLLEPSWAVINALRARTWYQTVFSSLTNVATDYARFYYPARENRILWDAKGEKAWAKEDDEHKEKLTKLARNSGSTCVKTLYPGDPGYDEQVAYEDEISAEEASDDDEMDIDNRVTTNGFG